MFESLGIDWKLLVFQIINFLFLLFILKKVLYKPIFNFLEARRRKIEEGLAKAEKFDEEWQRIKDAQNEKMAEIEQKALKIMEKARLDAQKNEKEMLEAARWKSEKIIEEAKSDMQKEKDKILQEIKGEASDLVIFAAEKILKRTLRESDEKNMAKEIIETLKKQ